MERLNNTNFSLEDLVYFLELEDPSQLKLLWERAHKIKLQTVGAWVYYRGLIEISNICSKDCYYCGIRASNGEINRYEMTEEQILQAVEFAWKQQYGSVVLQSGERSDAYFINKITQLVAKIKQDTNNEIGITLSCGEQSKETLERWRIAGAHRYLLRIESSNSELYRQIHPANDSHEFARRLQVLADLKDLSYQVGTGVMIGLPGQSIQDLARDLIFLRDLGVHMVGMGPYIEHSATPMGGSDWQKNTWPLAKRFDLAISMIALLRIMRPTINIAATTALQAINPLGREKALAAGANILMPNITPVQFRGDYLLYENRPCIDEDAEQCRHCLEARVRSIGAQIGYGQWGDSLAFEEKKR